MSVCLSVYVSCVSLDEVALGMQLLGKEKVAADGRKCGVKTPLGIRIQFGKKKRKFGV